MSAKPSPPETDNHKQQQQPPPADAERRLSQIWLLAREAAQAREAYEKNRAETTRLHGIFLDRQKELLEATRPPQPMPLYEQLEWRARPVSELAIPSRTVTHLERAGMRTLGELADYGDGRPLAETLHTVKGLSGFVAADIAQKLREYLDAQKVEDETCP